MGRGRGGMRGLVVIGVVSVSVSVSVSVVVRVSASCVPVTEPSV